MNTEIFLSLNCGQHVLFGFTVTALQGRTGRSLTITETLEVARLVMELTNESLYGDDMGECPDFKVMTDPETAYETFEPWVQSRTGNSLVQGAAQSNRRDIALPARTWPPRAARCKLGHRTHQRPLNA